MADCIKRDALVYLDLSVDEAALIRNLLQSPSKYTETSAGFALRTDIYVSLKNLLKVDGKNQSGIISDIEKGYKMSFFEANRIVQVRVSFDMETGKEILKALSEYSKKPFDTALQASIRLLLNSGWPQSVLDLSEKDALLILKACRETRDEKIQKIVNKKKSESSEARLIIYNAINEVLKVYHK